MNQGRTWSKVWVGEVEFHEDFFVSCVVVCFALEGSCHRDRGRCASSRCDCCGVHEAEESDSAACRHGSCGKSCFLLYARCLMELVLSCLGPLVVRAVDSLSSRVFAEVVV